MIKVEVAKNLTKNPYVNLAWAVLLYAAKANDILWREFMETETGKRFKDKKGIDVCEVAYDVGAYLWG